MFDEFLDAYIEAALWSTNDESDPSGGQPLDDNYSKDDLSPECLAQMTADCKAFFEAHSELFSNDVTLAGHDFWLTRNHHGSGFWDSDWEKDIGETLTKASHAFGECNLYVGDDGQIYC